LEKAMNPCGMEHCHDSEFIPVCADCQAYSPNSFHNNPQYCYAELLIHRMAMKKEILKNCLTVQKIGQHALEV
jgi:hypothetical protein